MDRKRNIGKDSQVEKNPNSGKEFSLVLHNDDIHDFNYVIESLIEICGHESVQAEQCAYIVHYRGQCDVKVGKFKQLRLMYEQLSEKGLTVTLNEQVCH